MPLEIKELHIKASVSDANESAGGAEQTRSGNSEETDQIITTCVEKVMEILKDKMER